MVWSSRREHSEERLDERDWVYSANHRATVFPPAALHTQLLACVVFVHVLYIWALGGGVGGVRAGGGGALTRSLLSLAGSAGWNESLHIAEVQFEQCV